METTVKQYDVYWVNLDPVEGSEMAKRRPCVVISPDEINQFLKTVTVAPLTSNLWSVQWRVPVFVDGQYGMVALDHIRSVSKTRLNNHLGHLQTHEIQHIKNTLKKIFVDE